MVVFLRIVTLKRLQRDTNPPEWGGGVYWYDAISAAGQPMDGLAGRFQRGTSENISSTYQ